MPYAPSPVFGSLRTIVVVVLLLIVSSPLLEFLAACKRVSAALQLLLSTVSRSRSHPVSSTSLKVARSSCLDPRLWHSEAQWLPPSNRAPPP